MLTEAVTLLLIVERFKGYLRSFEWDHFILRMCALFHLAFGLLLALAPLDQIETRATGPALHWAGRYQWAAIFLLMCAAILALDRVAHAWFRLVVWTGLLFVGSLWLFAFALAFSHGEGTAALVGWSFLYVLWTVVFVRVGLRER